ARRRCRRQGRQRPCDEHDRATDDGCADEGRRRLRRRASVIRFMASCATRLRRCVLTGSWCTFRGTASELAPGRLAPAPLAATLKSITPRYEHATTERASLLAHVPTGAHMMMLSGP